MTRFSQFAAGLAFAVAATLPTLANAVDPTDLIDYRKHVMKSLSAQAAALNMTLQGKAPAENFAIHAETLALVASTALMAFEPKAEGGDAKPEVWAKYDDFSKRMKEFAAGTAELAKAAKTGGAAAAQPMIQGALTCKNCHDVYRVKK
ncbi:MAG: cytochrome c [Rhodospirillaceae bacterium]|nr:cytochrome c [Rhodospirillaceae bacterium]